MAKNSAVLGICYVSKTLRTFDQHALLDLTLKAAHANKEHGISGYLCMRDEHFFQYIEGPNEKVRGLMNNIERDTRHAILTSLEDDKMKYRRFPNWRMRLLKPTDLDFLTLIFDQLLLSQQITQRDQKLEKMVFETISHFSTKFSGRFLLSETTTVDLD